MKDLAKKALQNTSLEFTDTFSPQSEIGKLNINMNNIWDSINDLTKSQDSIATKDEITALRYDLEHKMQHTISSILSDLQTKPMYQHLCNGCGAKIELDIDNHLFRCPYCGSAYAVGTAMINS